MKFGMRLDMALAHPSSDDVISNKAQWIKIAPDAGGDRYLLKFNTTMSGAGDAAQDTINYLNLVAAEIDRPRPHGLTMSDAVLEAINRGAFIQISAATFLDDEENVKYVVSHADVLEEARKRIMRSRGEEEQPEKEPKSKPKLKQPYKSSIINSKSPRIWKTPKDDKSLRVLDVEAVLPEPDKAPQVANDLMRAFVYAAAQLGEKGLDIPAPMQEGNVITIDARVLDKARSILERIQRER